MKKSTKAAAVPARVLKEIIKQEVNYVLFNIEIPTDTPWVHARRPKRVCPECGKSFVPPRWFSRFCSRECRSRDYARMYRAWHKKQEAFYLGKGGGR